MIRRTVGTGSHALGLAARVIRTVVDGVGDFVARAWQHHTELMAESMPYRQQLALVITATLGLLRLHPSFAVLAAALGALYVAAYQRRAEPAYERYPEPEPRYSDPDRKVGDDLHPRFHDRC